jgi:hypothetical protein
MDFSSFDTMVRSKRYYCHSNLCEGTVCLFRSMLAWLVYESVCFMKVSFSKCTSNN